MTDRERQVRAQQVFAIAVANVLIEVADPDLWMRAQVLARDAVFALRAKRGDAAERGPHGQGPEITPDAPSGHT